MHWFFKPCKSRWIADHISISASMFNVWSNVDMAECDLCLAGVASQSVHTSVCHYVCLSVCLSVCHSVCLSFCRSAWISSNLLIFNKTAFPLLTCCLHWSPTPAFGCTFWTFTDFANWLWASLHWLWFASSSSSISIINWLKYNFLAVTTFCFYLTASYNLLCWLRIHTYTRSLGGKYIRQRGLWSR